MKILLNTIFVFILFFNSLEMRAQDSLLYQAIKLVFQNNEVYDDFAISDPLLSKSCDKNVIVQWTSDDTLSTFFTISDCVVGLNKTAIFFYDPEVYAKIKKFKVTKKGIDLIIQQRWKIESFSSKFEVHLKINEGELYIVRFRRIVDRYKFKKKRVNRKRYNLLEPK